jgi:hypothetical protein
MVFRNRFAECNFGIIYVTAHVSKKRNFKYYLTNLNSML